MRYYLLIATAVIAVMLTHGAWANPVERACLQSNRTDVSRALCSCIGDAAALTLNRREMREGARFFSDPQRAQDVRTSDRRADERLWESWRAFGETAEAMCS